MKHKAALRTDLSEHSNYIIKALLSGLFCAMVPTVSAAVESSTLRQSVEYALTHNRTLQVSAQSVVQADAGMDDATGRLMPRIDLSSGVMRTNSPGDYFGLKLGQKSITAADFNPAVMNNPGYITNYQNQVAVSMPLYQGGALWAGRSMAAQRATASEQGHQYVRQQVIFQTISAYAHVRQAYAQMTAMQGAVKAAEKRYEDVRAMQKRGLLIKSDVMDARVHLLRTSLKLEQAKNAYADSRDMLALVMGVESGKSLEAGEEPMLRMGDYSLDQAVAEALANRPDLKATEAEQLAAESGVNSARAAFLPHVNLMAAQQWNHDKFGMKNRNSMIGATVTVNLFSGGSDRARMQAAQAEEIAMEYREEDQRRQIRNEAASSWRKLKEAELRYQSESEALKQSEESLRIKSLRYEQGLANTTDLLDAQVQADSARVAAIGAHYDLTVARAALLLVMGKLDEEVIQ